MIIHAEQQFLQRKLFNDAARRTGGRTNWKRFKEIKQEIKKMREKQK